MIATKPAWTITSLRSPHKRLFLANQRTATNLHMQQMTASVQLV